MKKEKKMQMNVPTKTPTIRDICHESVSRI